MTFFVSDPSSWSLLSSRGFFLVFLERELKGAKWVCRERDWELGLWWYVKEALEREMLAMEKDFDAKLRIQGNSFNGGNVQRSKSFAFRAPQENFSIQDFELGKIYGVGSYSKVWAFMSFLFFLYIYIYIFIFKCFLFCYILLLILTFLLLHFIWVFHWIMLALNILLYSVNWLALMVWCCKLLIHVLLYIYRIA